MQQNFTKEQIEEIFDRVIQENLTQIVDQYSFYFQQLDDEQKDNPLMRNILAAQLAQTNVMNCMKEIMCEIFAGQDKLTE